MSVANVNKMSDRLSDILFTSCWLFTMQHHLWTTSMNHQLCDAELPQTSW